MKINRAEFIHTWFPVLPFIGYWIVAYLAFHFGPFVTPTISFGTHLMLFLCLILFVLGYRAGIASAAGRIPRPVDYGDFIVAEKVLRRAAWLSFIGTFLFVFDRLNSGAGSFAYVQYEMANLRADYVDNTTFLTTIAVIPQSFYLVSIAAYFYCLMHKLPVSRTVHWLIFLTFAIEIVNMVLSANRGSLLWIATYVAFFVFFCARMKVSKSLFHKRNLVATALFLFFCFLSWLYFLYVAQNREVNTTVLYLGREASSLLKNNFVSGEEDFVSLAGQYQIFYYLTGGFEYVDLIFKNALPLNIDFLSPLGMRVEAQIARIFPDYVFPAKANIQAWVESAGLSRFNWVTIFGAAMAYFGIFGALLFFLGLGVFSGYATSRYLRSNCLGWLIIVFVVYASLNMSFDWLFRNFDQYVALLVGFYLIGRREPLPNLQRGCAR